MDGGGNVTGAAFRFAAGMDGAGLYFHRSSQYIKCGSCPISAQLRPISASAVPKSALRPRPLVPIHRSSGPFLIRGHPC